MGKEFLTTDGTGKTEYPDCTFFFFFGLFRDALATYGGSPARGPVGALAAGVRHGHTQRRIKSEPCLQPTA